MRHKKRRASRGFRHCLAASLPRQHPLRILWPLGGLKSVSDCYDFGLLGFRPRNRVLPQLPWDWLGEGGWRGGCGCCARRSPLPSPLPALSAAVSDRLRCERPEGPGLPGPLRRWASRPGRGTRAQLRGAGNLPALGTEKSGPLGQEDRKPSAPNSSGLLAVGFSCQFRGRAPYLPRSAHQLS